MKKHNVLVTVNGISKSRAQWAKELGVTKGAISLREGKGESASSAIAGIVGTVHTRKILKHYTHAREKHPYFCDTLDGYGRTKFPGCNSQTLEYERHCIAKDIEAGGLAWHQLLTCEMWEVFDALSYGDKAQAVEELYDCIAVCLRTIDVLEGRQKLGKPEMKGETK